jgi:hypothetical protein
MQQHDLVHELPEFKAKVEALKASDGQFSRLVDEYEEVNRHVVSVESNVEPATDFALEDMKKRRLKLKDQLYDILKAA